MGEVAARHDTTEVVVSPGNLTQVMTALHDDPTLRFEMLADLCGVDTGTTMQVVYHLWSPLSPDWLRVIADGLSREDPRVPSVTYLWNGAEWAEREAYDMFGIIFEGNRDLRRIFMPPDYRGFPLRKDFLLADDASRSPGMGVRPMEQPFPAGEMRFHPVLRRSPGAGGLTSRLTGAGLAGGSGVTETGVTSDVASSGGPGGSGAAGESAGIDSAASADVARDRPDGEETR